MIYYSYTDTTRAFLTPYNLHPAPYILHPTPYTLHPTPYTLHPAPSQDHPPPRAEGHATQQSVGLVLGGRHKDTGVPRS